MSRSEGRTVGSGLVNEVAIGPQVLQQDFEPSPLAVEQFDGGSTADGRR